MTLALQTESDSLTPGELLLHFLERIEDWADTGGVGGAAASVLRERLKHPTVSIFRLGSAPDVLQVVAVAPHGGEGLAPGSRLPLGRGALGTAVREGRTQRTMQAYVEPDFVRSLPGDTRSELVVPILRGGAVLGAVRLEYSSLHRPTAEAEALADLLTQPLAVALEIDAARSAAPPADAAVARRLRHARTLSAVAEQLARAEDASAALQRVVQGAAELVSGESVVVLLRHRERKMLEVAAASGLPRLAIGELIPMEGTIPGTVLTHGRPVQMSGLGAGADRFCGNDAERAIRDTLVVPLIFGGKAFGAVAVLNCEGGGAAPEEVELLQSLANQAALLDAIRQMGPLRQQISDASMIAEVGRAMTGTLGLEEVLDLVVQAAQMLVNGHCAAVGLVSEEDELRLVSTSGVLRASEGISIPLHGSLMGWVVLGGETVITASVSEDPRSFPHDVRHGPGVVVPLESRGQILGGLLVARRPGAPTPGDEDLDALRKLGAYAAIAIDNARLYQAQRELSLALQAQTEELEFAYSELRSSQERLVVSEKMAALGRVTAGIAHEINSPLGSILNCLQLAQSYALEYQASANDPDVSADDHLGIAGDLIDSLTLAEGAARRVAQFVRTIKSQTRVGEESIVAFDPVAEIDNTVALLQHELRNRKVEVRVEAEPGQRITGDPAKFAVIVQNLLSNAIDAMDGAEGDVCVRVRTTRTNVVLEVEDHGSGIPEEIRPRIYDYLFTTKDIGQGTGLGLSMVHSIVTSSFKGEIDFRSEVGVGTTFFITFPASAETE